jgi:hypothetical protein
MFKTADTGTLKQDKKCQPCWYIILSTMSGSTTINNLTKYFKESKYKNYAASVLKEVIGILSKICVQNRVALICTGDANAASRGLVPWP